MIKANTKAAIKGLRRFWEVHIEKIDLKHVASSGRFFRETMLIIYIQLVIQKVVFAAKMRLFHIVFSELEH